MAGTKSGRRAFTFQVRILLRAVFSLSHQIRRSSLVSADSQCISKAVEVSESGVKYNIIYKEIIYKNKVMLYI